MDTDVIRRELFSMESLIAVVAIAVALSMVYLTDGYRTMENGSMAIFATAVYPPMYYRESGRVITKPILGVLHGSGTAAGIYILFMFCYRLAERTIATGIHAEAVAFVLISVFVFGSALLERRYVNTDSGTDTNE